MVNGVSPEVHHNLLCLPHFEGQVVSTTPFSQLCHFLSVVRFIVVADETYHSCVISKLDDVVGAELGSAVVGQQCEEQRAEHTALWVVLLSSTKIMTKYRQPLSRDENKMRRNVNTDHVTMTIIKCIMQYC